MSANLPTPSFSTPREGSLSPWSASGQESLTLAPIRPQTHGDEGDYERNLHRDLHSFFRALPEIGRLHSQTSRLPPVALPPRPSGSNFHYQERPHDPPPSNQQAQEAQQPSFGSERPRGHYGRLSESPDPFGDFIEDDIEYASPPSSTRESSIVDLTSSSPPTSHEMPPKKRKAEAADEGRRVRRRVEPAKGTRTTPSRAAKLEGADVVDLVDMAEHESYLDFTAKQKAVKMQQQQQEEATRPVKLAEFQCIICMDNPTDLTVTHCGHLFCSECLHQALYAGTAKKCCPVCRTPVNPGSVGKKAGKNGVFALEMKLMTAKKKGKQPVRAD